MTTTPSVTPSPIATPTPASTATAATEPTQEPVYPNAINAARVKLAKQINLRLEDVMVVSYERVEWPDSCLGVRVSGVMCAMIVTSGFRIILEAQSRQYEYHSNADGSTIVQANTAGADGQKPVLIWRPSTGECMTGLVTTRLVSSVPCKGAPISSELTETMTQALKHFMTGYASFSATTPIGDVTFIGSGAQNAPPVMQRAIAEFARYATLEAGPKVSQSDVIAFSWHRQGGIAGFCDDVTVSAFGQLQVSSCRTKPAQPLGIQWLDTTQLQQIYDWIDQYKAFRITHDGPVSPDELVITMEFNGRGSADAPDNARQAISAFAQVLRTTLKPS